MKLDYDGSAGLAPLDPSEARQVSRARDDGIREVRREALRFVKLDYDGSAGLRPWIPREQGRKARLGMTDKYRASE